MGWDCSSGAEEGLVNDSNLHIAMDQEWRVVMILCLSVFSLDQSIYRTVRDYPQDRRSRQGPVQL